MSQSTPDESVEEEHDESSNRTFFSGLFGLFGESADENCSCVDSGITIAGNLRLFLRGTGDCVEGTKKMVDVSELLCCGKGHEELEIKKINIYIK